MPEENVDVVRKVYDEWAKGNMGAGLELFDPEIRFETFMPDSNDRVTASGPEAVGAFMRDFLSDWRNYRLIGDEFEAVGDDRVLVRGRQKGTGRQSGVAVEDTMCSGWTFRDGRVVRLVFEREPGEARDAIAAE